MTRSVNPFVWGLASVFLMTSCDMVDLHPYDVKIEGPRDVNASNIARIETACRDKDTIRFVTMGDSQRWYDETVDFVNAVNVRTDIDFVIHGGDMSDFGVTDEFLWQRDIMDGLNFPYVAIIGNHDCLGTGEETYRAVFGDTDFSFIAGRIKFVCLNTNAMEYDYSRPIPDFDYMEDEISRRREEYDRTVVCMHARPYSDSFNNNVARVFQAYVTAFPGLLFCTAAHEHRQFEMDVFGDGVMYYVSDCMKHRSYNVFTVTPDGYEHEVVYY
ncbi:metallophosphoesterase [uncultured Bacteroides sp.]|jgi:predicted phosphodiesterase|uniref:metallophosphoesterase family protein n=1 Tax=uncultured Bacteroides sp. TaxID=162156 RepID=UPI00280B5979|nr:metallophosphoesterase [uncultured Bacteroides sp.]